ncbi:hypothetical protein EV359DRAFT_4838, partial [Lentinula novae-zelandiae]
LPGVLKLYIGMPVVLKHKNLNTELGITNGAKGFIRKLELGSDVNGFTYCIGALVEFPNSKVELDGLPKGVYPIKPRRWQYNAFIFNEENQQILVSVSRFQVPFEPAFALTGQSAQGYTLAFVLCLLHLGGYGAY